MKTMLLSFKPQWFDRIKDGSKIFEYRRSFANEEVMAYMYVSSPRMEIVGKIHLGKRIDIHEWLETYKDDKAVTARVEDFITRHSYAMPIKSFQMTESISVAELREFNSKFVCPQMYYYLDNYPDLFEFIKKNAIEVGELIEHRFDFIDKEDICRKVY